MSLLLRDGRVLTLDASGRMFRGDVRIEDGVVSHLGEDVPQQADEVIELDGDLVLPGFVNAHTHAAMTLLRGLGEDLALEDWLRSRIWPAEAYLTAADVAAGSDLALVEMARTGTVAFNDMYFFADTTIERTRAAGLRANIAATLIDFDTPEMAQDAQIDYARDFIARYQDDALIRPTLGPHATYTCSADTLDAVRDLHQASGAPVHTHCSETRHEVQDVLSRHGARPLEVLDRHGLTDGAILAHCGWVTKEEVRQMARRGAHAAHCPVSNLKLGTGGTMPLEEMREAGVNIALGTDGAASNNTLDILETAKFTALIQKNHRWDARAAPADAVLRMATLGGRRALGLDADGLVKGARADLAIVRTDAPHMTPLYDPIAALVHAANGHDVRATIVGGRVVYQDGAYPTLDVPRIMARAREHGARLAAQAADAAADRR